MVFFLKAPVENKSSLIWYGILWGRKLFMKGMRWRVGNGRRIINIDQDQWLAKKGPDKILSLKDRYRGKLVISIILKVVA